MVARDFALVPEQVELNPTGRTFLVAAVDLAASAGELTQLREQLELRRRLLEVVAKISALTARFSDLPGVLFEALGMIGEAGQFSRCLLLKRQAASTAEDVDRYEVFTEWCAQGVHSHHDCGIGTIASLDAAEFIRKLRHGKTFWCRIDEVEEPLRSLFERMEICATGCAPIVVHDELWGTLAFDDCVRNEPWDEAHIDALTSVANAISNALETQRRAEDLATERAAVAQERLAELAKSNAALRHSIDALSQQTGLMAFVDQVLQTVAEQLQSPLVEYWENPSPTTARLVSTHRGGQTYAGSDWPDDPRIRSVFIPTELAYSTDLTQRETYFIVEDLPGREIEQQTWGQLGLNLAEWCRKRGVRKYINVPLRTGATTIGALVAYFPAERSISSSSIELALALAQQITLAVTVTDLSASAASGAATREREIAARDRALELTKANEAMRGTLGELAETNELKDFVRFALLEISRQAGAVAVHLFEYLQETDELRQVALVRNAEFYPDGRADDPPEFRAGFAAGITDAYRILCEEEKGLICQTTDDPTELTWAFTTSWHQRMGHASHASIALRAGSRPIGLLGLAFNDRLELSESQRMLVVVLSQQISLAMEITRLADESKQTALLREREIAAQGRAAELTKANEALRRSVEQISFDQRLPSILNSFLCEAARALEADGGVVMLRVPGEDFIFRTEAAFDGQLLTAAEIQRHPYLGRFAEFTANDPDGMHSRLARGESVTFPVDSLAASFPEAFKYHRARGDQSIWSAPLRLREEVLGFFSIALRSNSEPTQSQRETITALAQQLVLAVEITRLAEVATQAAIAQEREAAAQRRAAELDLANQALRKGIAGLGQLDDLSHFLGEMLKAAVATSGAHSGGVVILDEAAQTYRVYPLLRAHGVFEPQGTELTSPHPLSPAVKNLFSDINATPTAWLMTETDNRMDPEFVNYHRAEGNVLVAHIPMRVGDRLVGMLGLGFPTRDAQFEKEFSLLRSLADQMCLAVEMVRLSDEAKSAAAARAQERAAWEHAAELARANEALRKGVDGLVRLENLDLFLREMLKAAVMTAGAQGGVVALLEKNQEFYRFAALQLRDGSFAPESSPLLQPIRVSPELRIYLNAIASDTEAWPLPPEDPLHAPDTRAFLKLEQLRALRHVPMVVNGRLIGWLGLGFTDVNPEFGRSHSLLRVLADQMTMAVELLRVSEEARSAAVAREQETAAQARAVELARVNDQLALRDRLLTASAKALEQLISAKDFSLGITDALRQIGEAAQLSRVQVLMEITMPSGDRAHELVHEWWSDGLISQKSLGYLVFPNVDYQEVVDRLYKGERWWARTEHWPSEVQPAFRELGIVWTGVVPIFVQQRYVGLVAFDQCSLNRNWSEAEIDALTIAARGIGAALSQEHMAAQLVREREQAAQDRASELVKANNALRSSVDDLVTQTTTDGILTSLLKQAVDISGAKSGAILKRLAGSEFEYVTICADGVIRTSQEILAAGTNTEMRLASRLDPTGHYKTLANGDAQWREVDDEVLAQLLPRSTSFHKTAGNKRIYDFPYKVAGQVFGYLGLAFADHEPPSDTVQETIKALATQVGLALEFRRISEKVERAAVTEERNKFARDLHDTLAQGFAAIIMQLGAADQVGPMPVTIQPYLTRIEDLARSNLAEARKTVSELRTSERVRDSLLVRLSELSRKLELTYGSVVQLSVMGSGRPWPPLVEDELYLIAQESLTNAMRHAQAVEVKIEISFLNNGLRMKIKDNGKGFSSEDRGKPDHFGLQTMQERSQRIKANLTIISEPGFGTEILTLWNEASLEQE